MIKKNKMLWLFVTLQQLHNKILLPTFHNIIIMRIVPFDPRKPYECATR